MPHVNENRAVCFATVSQQHSLPWGPAGLHYTVRAFLTGLCFPSGTPVQNDLWRIIKCFKKEGLDPHLSLPSSLFFTQAISMFLENHASPTKHILYLIFKKSVS